jgi:hypothetical protein
MDPDCIRIQQQAGSGFNKISGSRSLLSENGYEILNQTIKKKLKKGDYLDFSVLYSTCYICRLSNSTLSEDAGIEPMTVATPALAVDALTTRLDPLHCGWDQN